MPTQEERDELNLLMLQQGLDDEGMPMKNLDSEDVMDDCELVPMKEATGVDIFDSGYDIGGVE